MRAARRAEKVQQIKLELLAACLGIPDGSGRWMELAGWLADKPEIPGLRIVWARAKRWHFERRCQLIADVEVVRRELHCGDAEACREIILRWPERYGKSHQAAKSLNNRLVEARTEDALIANTLASDGETHDEKMDALIGAFAADQHAAAEANVRVERRAQENHPEFFPSRPLPSSVRVVFRKRQSFPNTTPH